MGSEGYRRTIRALRKSEEAVIAKHKASYLDRRPISDPMWEALEDLHLSRLNKERGRRRKCSDRTMVALANRGLATSVTAPEPCPYCRGEDCGVEVVLWRTTDAGRALAMAGRE